MGNETKWADVAHYYAKAPITVQYKHEPMDRLSRWSYSIQQLRESMLRIENGLVVNPDGAESLAYTPILRHLDDMTEAECIDYTEFVWADSEFSKVNRSQKISVVWAKDSVNLREMYRQCLFAVRQKGIMWPFFPKDINQLGFHWLISRGFDVFGLIESGQAIRKGAGNG